jgi:hypothetical protein
MNLFYANNRTWSSAGKETKEIDKMVDRPAHKVPRLRYGI